MKPPCTPRTKPPSAQALEAELKTLLHDQTEVERQIAYIQSLRYER